jgi:hypothetical protein
VCGCQVEQVIQLGVVVSHLAVPFPEDVDDGVLVEVGGVGTVTEAALPRPRDLGGDNGHCLLPQLSQAGIVAIDQRKVGVAPQRHTVEAGDRGVVLPQI